MSSQGKQANVGSDPTRRSSIQQIGALNHFASVCTDPLAGRRGGEPWGCSSSNTDVISGEDL